MTAVCFIEVVLLISSENMSEYIFFFPLMQVLGITPL